jgi:hypothetical protein
MSEENNAIINATPLEQKPVDQYTGPRLLEQHEGRLDGFLSVEASVAMRARQASRARAMGLLLGAAALLFFAITIVKTGGM